MRADFRLSPCSLISQARDLTSSQERKPRITNLSLANSFRQENNRYSLGKQRQASSTDGKRQQKEQKRKATRGGAGTGRLTRLPCRIQYIRSPNSSGRRRTMRCLPMRIRPLDWNSPSCLLTATRLAPTRLAKSCCVKCKSISIPSSVLTP